MSLTLGSSEDRQALLYTGRIAEMGRRLVSIIENLAIRKPETSRHQQEEAVDPRFQGHPCL